MAYVRTYVIDASPGGDTVKAAVATKLDGDLTNAFTYLNAHDIATTNVHGCTGAATGTGALVRATSPTFVTPTIGVATATSINKVAITAPATSATLTISDGKTFSCTGTLTLSGTDGSTLNIGTGGTLGTAAYTAATAYEVSGAVSSHAALITGVHGLVFTAGKTFTLTESLTVNSAAVGALRVATAANTIGDLAVGLTTQILVGGGAGTVPAWGADIPTAVTIGTAYIYRVGGTDVAIADGGTGQGTAQAAIDALTAVSGATNEHVLTKDTVSGNAIFKVALSNSMPMGYLSGLAMSHDTDTDHDILIAVGKCRDSTDAADITLAIAITKRADAGWGVGDDQGGMDTGSIPASGTLHVWLIKRSDTGVVDALFSISATAPTMPANYDYKRLIGSYITDASSNIINGDWLGTDRHRTFTFDTPLLDVDNANPGTNANTGTLSTPGGIKTKALTNVDGVACYPYVSSLDSADIASSGYPGAASQGDARAITFLPVSTNTSSQIRYRCASDARVYIATLGWEQYL